MACPSLPSIKHSFFFVILVAPVVITSQPDDVTVVEGNSARFTVEATGDGLTYQWLKDGSVLTEETGKLEGVNTGTLTVLNVMINDDGNYICVISNGADDSDSEASSAAFLQTIGKTALLLLPLI